MKENKIFLGEALQVLKDLPKESIDMCITSPPYWSLRDYHVDGVIWNEDKSCNHEFIKSFCKKCNAWRGQLGLEPNFDLYIKHLCDIFDEVKRVLKNEGTCWINLGDTYAGSGVHSLKNANKGLEGRKIKEKAFPKKGQKPQWSKFPYPSKCLLMIPLRFAIEMINRGWILRNVIIWHKSNAMPSPAKDRFTVDFEYVFFFSKSKKYYFHQQREPHKDTSLKRLKYQWKGHREPMSSYQSIDIKKMCHPDGRNKRCVWTIPTSAFRGKHFAVYPPSLIETPIKAGCPEQGIVLDPFMGSGTTALVALKQNKKFLGIELNPNYIEIAEKRIKSIKI